jgi:hypothetical protein
MSDRRRGPDLRRAGRPALLVYPEDPIPSVPAYLLGHPVCVEDGFEGIGLRPIRLVRNWDPGYVECTDRECAEWRYGLHAHRQVAEAER